MARKTHPPVQDAEKHREAQRVRSEWYLAALLADVGNPTPDDLAHAEALARRVPQQVVGALRHLTDER